jgi:hypothetical protein
VSFLQLADPSHTLAPLTISEELRAEMSDTLLISRRSSTAGSGAGSGSGSGSASGTIPGVDTVVARVGLGAAAGSGGAGATVAAAGMSPQEVAASLGEFRQISVF